MENKKNNELDELVEKMLIVSLWDRLDSDKAFVRFRARRKRIRIVLFASVAASCIGVLFVTSYWFSSFVQDGNNSEQICLSVKDGASVRISYSDGENYELPVSGLNTDSERSKGDTVYVIDQDLIKTKSDYRKDRIVTLITPRGKHVNVKLADGTTITLNSETTLKYPEQFKQNCRELEISGEALFEVAKETSRPFIVRCRDVQVEVLGTIFNINSYDVNETVQATLVEGAVDCRITGEPSIRLYPGEQFVYNVNSAQAFKQEVDVNDYVSWIHNRTVLRNNTLQEIFFRIASVYNIEITCTNRVDLKEKYHIIIQADEDLENVLSRLSFIGGMIYRKEDNLIVFDRP